MLPWGEMLRAALAAGIEPAAFWHLSLREWRCLSGAGAGPSLEGLTRLMQDFPDKVESRI